MSTEDLIREIVSKQCPFHGKHPTIEIHEVGQMEISACCEEFRQQIGMMVNAETQGSFRGIGSPEIT